MKTRTIKVDYLARVEGEGALQIKIDGDRLEELHLRIFEPPRFFEALLRGRAFTEAPDITARICGICPVAYQMSSIHAMERLCGVAVDPIMRSMRRLLYCGEWIESHALHIYCLHAPDFLGYESAVHLAKDHPEWVKRGLALKKVGNSLMALLGGREIHPINVRVGGFYRMPSASELRAMKGPLTEALAMAEETALWVAGLPFPDLERDYTFVCLSHPDEYPMNRGRLISNRELDLDVADYETRFREEHLSHSTSLYSRLDGEHYLVGPLARVNLCFDRLSPRARRMAEKIGFAPTCTNPFKSIIARALEVIHVCEESCAIIDGYVPPEAPYHVCNPVAGQGFACTEAPRGILYHRYAVDGEGLIQEAKIVPPTSQNQGVIEADLRDLVRRNLALPDDRLQWLCEQAIRNYDPCISCSTHFLDMKVERS
ncbi:Ni/Fe hydrogenase subunit alpha [Sulfidibacter corallicola]|uniref:Ni/Fe hydrogenase subunit alpha n=1 Tax=Sulfidibacter corallicola TaxID=2818388 RepID=A0A8A4TVW4_SULCO|nr:Ni/Fe hydrogenase subunit alpha [Sulfidibacter corallicola]QTD53640.1 Ni/Fe hydrogenase subunit alpha [Sulfidibacter corallicola]